MVIAANKVKEKQMSVGMGYAVQSEEAQPKAYRDEPQKNAQIC